MAIKGYYHGNSTYNAIDLRRAQNERYTPGVIGRGDFAGSVQSTTTFRLAPGSAVVPYGNVGKFSVYSDSHEDVTLTAGSGVKRRYLVYLRVQDQENADVSDTVSIETTYTEHATSPSLPTTTHEHIPLYDITINSGSTLLSGTTVINDLRTFSRPIGMPLADDFWFYDQVNSGNSTSATTFATHTGLLVASMDCRMEVHVSGYCGFTTGANQIQLGITDNAGSGSGWGPNGNSRSQILNPAAGSDWMAINMQAYKDFNEGDTLGYHLTYQVNSNNVYIRATSRMVVKPR